MLAANIFPIADVEVIAAMVPTQTIQSQGTVFTMLSEQPAHAILGFIQWFFASAAAASIGPIVV